MNIGGLFGALTPVFFVLALGYFAGKRNAFDADQSAGLSKLALTFALPASLFVSLTDIRKDLLLEWRSRDAITGMLFFTLLVAVVFSIAFDPAANPTLAREIAGGILWVGLLFAASTALNSSWNHETQNQVLDAHRLSPSAPSAFFLGKALANFVFVAVVELVLAPVFTIFFNLHPLGDTRWLWLIMPFGTWALIVNGTFFAALGLMFDYQTWRIAYGRSDAVQATSEFAGLQAALAGLGVALPRRRLPGSGRPGRRAADADRNSGDRRRRGGDDRRLPGGR